MNEKTLVFFKIALIALIASLSQLVLPWWTIAVIPFAVDQIGKSRPYWSFSAGFYGISIYWMAIAFVLDYRNSHLLATRMLKIFGLPNYYILLILLTGLIGGIIGGLSAISGAYFQEAFRKQKAA